MYLLSGGSIFTGRLIQALCWVLVHSLWQGLLLAGVVALIVLFTKKRSAAVRYNLMVSALMVFIAAVSATFYLQVNDPLSEIATVSQNFFGINTVDATTVVEVPLTTENTSLLHSLTWFFNRYATAIVFIWFLIIGVKMAQMAAGLYSIQQIKRRKVSSVGSYWNLRVQQLSAQMKISCPVKFLQSGIVKVPMVIGYFKPVIFFPLGALASLSPADVESILLHELAHIMRKDYLVNMLQHFVEIIFFFNPTVLWVSGLIKTERENCCDDIALAQTNNKRAYINALVSFQEFDETPPRYATAFAGKKDHLLQRVKRIISNNNKTFNNMEKIFLIICFLLTGTLTLVFSQTVKTKQATTATTQQKEKTETKELTGKEIAGFGIPATQLAEVMEEGTTVSYSDMAAKPSRHFISKRDGNIYEIYGDITWFQINGKEISKADWDKYKTIMNDMMSHYAELAPEVESFTLLDTPKNAKLLAELKDLKEHQQKIAAEEQKLAAQQQKLAAEDQKLAAEDQKLASAEQRRAMMTDSSLSDSQRKRMAEQKNVLDQQTKKLDEQKVLLEHQKKLMEEDKQKAEEKKKQLEKKSPSTTVSTNTNQNVNIKRTEDTDKYYTVTGLSYKVNDAVSNKVNDATAKEIDVQALTNEIIADLKINNIISSATDLTYQLTSDQLVVNGKVQSEVIHTMLRNKYIKNPDWKLLYNWKQKSN